MVWGSRGRKSRGNNHEGTVRDEGGCKKSTNLAMKREGRKSPTDNKNHRPGGQAGKLEERLEAS